MTPDILTVLIVLVGAVVLFVTGRVRVDVVALMVLLTLSLSGIVSYESAVAGFSSQAVITIASVLVLSGGLARTGFAGILSRRVLRWGGQGEARLLVIVMGTVGLMSGIMNNIAVSALMLPVVVDIARRTGRAPSKLLIPLAFGSLLGGMTTLIGTAPNVLISGALRDSGREPFSMFDFSAVGGPILIVGIAYMVLVGRRLLPERDIGTESRRRGGEDLTTMYGLPQALATLRVPVDSVLVGSKLSDTRLRSALGLNVMAIVHDGRTTLAPGPEATLAGGDRLVVEGAPDRLEAVRSWLQFEIEERWKLPAEVFSELLFTEIVIGEGSEFIGQSLEDLDLGAQARVHVLAIHHAGRPRLTRLHRIPLEEADRVLVVGTKASIEALEARARRSTVRRLSVGEVAKLYDVGRRLFAIRVPGRSTIDGMALVDTRLREAFDLSVLVVHRPDEVLLLPSAQEVLRSGDVLVIEGRHEDFDRLGAMQELVVDDEAQATLGVLESSEVGVTEVVLAPRSELVGKSLRQAGFRDRFGVTVIALWREGRVMTEKLHAEKLRVGDAMLVYGQRDRLRRLSHEDDLIVLIEVEHEVQPGRQAVVAGGLMAGVVASVASGLLPVHIAALSGATLMVLTGCLTGREAYEAIEWKAVVLIAGMLSLGTAMHSTGAAELVAGEVLGRASALGPRGVVAGLFAITVVAAQIMPTAAVAVLMSQIALSASADLTLSPQALLMVVAVGSSVAFMSPLGHPVNLMVMGVGGYRFTDYTKVGFPLALLLGLIIVFWLPVVWPLGG